MATEPTFETTHAQLQEVVTKLEQGDLGLDGVTTLYEKGLILAAKCRELLEATESRLMQIQRTFAMSVDSDEHGGY